MDARSLTAALIPVFDYMYNVCSWGIMLHEGLRMYYVRMNVCVCMYLYVDTARI